MDQAPREPRDPEAPHAPQRRAHPEVTPAEAPPDALAGPPKPPRTLNQRRLAIFKNHTRGFVSLWIFLALFLLTLFAEFIANDRPLLISYNGEILAPVLVDYPEEKFGGFLAVTDYSDPFIRDEIEANGWMIWPPIRYDYDTRNLRPPTPLPSAPSWMFSKEERCSALPGGADDQDCNVWNWNWLGTDDQGRDVLARVIYGFRISILFGLVLTAASSVIGIAAGAVQGYFGGWTDLLFQRFIEIWTSVPALYIILILSAVFTPNFFLLLGILLLFSWVALVGVVRAEFLRARNFEYVSAARALGVGNITIMWRHLLPNAMVATLTFLPFIMNGSITTLTSLDFLGFGLPPGSASLGELLAQGKNNIQAPWLGITGFIVISLMLSLLIFIGEAVRDAFDPRKTFAAAGSGPAEATATAAYAGDTRDTDASGLTVAGGSSARTGAGAGASAGAEASAEPSGNRGER